MHHMQHSEATAVTLSEYLQHQGQFPGYSWGRAASSLSVLAVRGRLAHFKPSQGHSINKHLNQRYFHYLCAELLILVKIRHVLAVSVTDCVERCWEERRGWKRGCGLPQRCLEHDQGLMKFAADFHGLWKPSPSFQRSRFLWRRWTWFNVLR